MSKYQELYVDGLNTFLRHFSANPTVSLNGQYCGGVTGFLKFIESIVKKYSPENVIICWEGGGSYRRRSIDKNYKNGKRPIKLNRLNEDIPDTTENRDYQLSLLIKILNEFPVKQIYLDDCEADDIISFLCHENKSKNKLIISSDKDYYQLIDENTHVHSLNRKVIIDTNSVIDTFGISPSNFCLARCITGDQSDGIKGVKGIAFKTLNKIYPELSGLNSFNIDDIINESHNKINAGLNVKTHQNILNSKNDIEKNWKLMYLTPSNLAYYQINKIKTQLETNKKSINKLNVLKLMNSHGINFYDIQQTFLVFTYDMETR